jgi:enoyl-CoA hydratase/carnithine racemase
MEILFHVTGHIGMITLNRPQALNAINHPMTRALQAQLSAWEANANIHAIIIQAAACRAFCAGGDVRDIYHQGQQDPLLALSYFYDEYRLNAQIHRLTKPYIALMNGLTFGGGVGVSLHGSHRVAFENFVFAMPENHIGLFPDIGASYLFAQLPEALSRYLSLCGHRLNADQAKNFGLVDYTMPYEQREALLTQLSQLDLRHEAHARVSACLAGFQQKLSIDDAAHAFNEEDVQRCFAFPTLPAIVSALQKTANKWAEQTHYTLSKCAPTSLEVNLLQLQKARGLSLADCLEMDYILVYHFLHHTDFYEGVRARLIAKDHSPQWSLAMDSNAYFIPPTRDWSLHLAH